MTNNANTEDGFIYKPAMKIEEFEKFVRENDFKYQYSLATVTLAILAISIQFSPTHGHSYASALITSWAFLLLSTGISAYRIEAANEFHRRLLRAMKSNSDVEAGNEYRKALNKRKNVRLLWIAQLICLACGVIGNALFLSLNLLYK